MCLLLSAREGEGGCEEHGNDGGRGFWEVGFDGIIKSSYQVVVCEVEGSWLELRFLGFFTVRGLFVE